MFRQPQQQRVHHCDPQIMSRHCLFVVHLLWFLSFDLLFCSLTLRERGSTDVLFKVKYSTIIYSQQFDKLGILILASV